MSMRFSAGIVVARRQEGSWLLLLLRAYRNWDFPKGMSEEGESPLDTAVRETREETGLENLSFSWGAAFIETSPYGNPPKIARYYLAETDRSEIILPISEELGRPEHDEWKWVDFIEAEELLPERLKPVLSWAKRKLA